MPDTAASGPLPSLTVAIPMLGRAHEVRRLFENLADTTTHPYRLVFVCSPSDPEVIEAANRHCASWIVSWSPGRGDYARKINHVFAGTHEPWFFSGASDLTFEKGWDREAISLGEEMGASVVGTNDMASAYVKSGKGATHILVRRSYIEEYGGTIDGSGLVYCELYDHQYVDNELVETAKVRGQWAFASHSVVHHAHPHWHTAEMDATYEKAFRHTAADRALFGKRMRRLKVLAQSEARRKLRYNRAL